MIKILTYDICFMMIALYYQDRDTNQFFR